MSRSNKPTAIQKRSDKPSALARFDLLKLKGKLPLVFSLHPDLPSSPKRKYRSHYRYLGWHDLADDAMVETLCAFQVALRVFDYSALEPLLAAHIYCPSAKGQVPFHPVSMYLLSLYRRERKLSRHEVLRQLRHEQEGRDLRRYLGFNQAFPSESGLRYFENQITPRLQQEINALQIDALYQAGLLPCQPSTEHKVTLSFDGMLHQARSRMRCSSVRAGCYEPAPRPCPAQAKNKQGCDCVDDRCASICRYATPRDPEARFIVYSGSNKRAHKSPNTSKDEHKQRSRRARMVFGYYSYAGQMLDDELATYWNLPAAFAAATCGDETLFPDNFTYLQSRFSWLKIGEVIADAAACTQRCLDLIWDAGALRLVDICAHQSDDDPDIRLQRGYDENGYPLCPFGYVLHANGHDYQRRRTKWRCAKRCQTELDQPAPECDYLNAQYKHGYTTTVGRTHADGTLRLAREIPYGSPAWMQRYHRRNSAESRNSVLQRLGLKRLPVHGLSLAHVIVLMGDLVANQRTLVRLIREAVALRQARSA
jgi:hypothetical protein